MPFACRSLLLVLLVSGLVWGQTAKPIKASRPPVKSKKGVPEPPPGQGDVEAAQAVEENRDFARRMPVKSRGPLGTWEQERVKVFREAKDSVVFVTTVAKGLVPTSPFTHDERMIPTGTGSGFVWDKAGHIVTNYHVVASVQEAVPGAGAEVRVSMADGTAYDARIIGYSPANDVAVLHVFAPLAHLKPLVAGSSRDLLVGQSVLAIGNPFGLDHSMSQGIVSALGRELQTSYGTAVKGVIQTDAAINPGNSGGPLLDSAGRLLGMNTAIQSPSGASAGIGFAIPVDVLQDVVPRLIAEEKLVKKLYFGFTTMPRDGSALLGVPGVIVAEVEAGSPAERAGLRAWNFDRERAAVVKEGDTILGCRGVRVETEYQLYAMLEQTPAGHPLELDVHREGKLIKVVITPERRAMPAPVPEKKKAVEI